MKAEVFDSYMLTKPNINLLIKYKRLYFYKNIVLR